MDEIGHQGLEILNAARRWARARVAFRRVLDSKRATPAQIEQAKNGYNRISHEMETMVGKMEQMLLLSGRMVPAKRRPKNPFPWDNLIRMLAQTGAQALSDTLNTGATPGAPAPPGKDVIDVPSEVVDKD